MKLTYEFKQGDYVVCTGLERDQIQSIVDRMVECGANLYEDSSNYSESYDALTWYEDGDGDTYFLGTQDYAVSEFHTEVKWEDIIKQGEIVMDVTKWECFEEVALVIGEDKAKEELNKVGENIIKEDETLIQAFDWAESPQGSIFWNNIDDSINPYGDDFIKPCDVEKVVEPESDNTDKTSLGYHINQIQLNIAPSSPEVIITADARVVLYGLEQEWDVSGKDAEEIDEVYRALDLLMGL